MLGSAMAAPRRIRCVGKEGGEILGFYDGSGDAMRILFGLLLSSTLLASASPWTTKDKVLEGAFVVATALDWRQTLDIKNHSNLYEQNHVLGRHPSNTTINTYFVTSIVFHAVVADQLHGKWRTAWQAVWIGLEVGTVQRNYALGIRLNF